MKQLLMVVMVAGAVLCGGIRPAAQTISGVKPLVQPAVTLNATDTGACSTAGACTSLSLGGFTGVSVQLFGTCGTCTVQFEMTVDGTNWTAVSLTPTNGTTPVTSTSTAGVWQGTVPGKRFRARMSARLSGSFSVSLQATISLAKLNLTDSGSAVPGGSDTQVQFNDGGSFGADGSLTYNKTTHVLTSANPITVGATPNAYLTGSTSSLGGGALLAGACASGTATVTGATTAMTATASPVTYPGDGNYVLAYVSAGDTVTVKVCAAVAGTPVASVYRVRVVE